MNGRLAWAVLLALFVGTVAVVYGVDRATHGPGWHCYWDITYDYDYSNDISCKRGMLDGVKHPRATSPEEAEAMLNSAGK